MRLLFSDDKRLGHIVSQIEKLKRSGRMGISMRLRLFAFLILLVVTMLLFLATVLAVTGVFNSGRGEAEKLVDRELRHMVSGVERQYGDTAVQAVLLSESLSKSIEKQLEDEGLKAQELNRHPDVLEDIMNLELNRLLLALEKTKCSGVFLVLNATVNPELMNSEDSRAGLYIRNAEPNVAGEDSTKLCVRGFPQIALQNGLSLQSKWDMEFDVQGRSFYWRPVEMYREKALPLSRLYYWTFEKAIPDLNEDVLLCSIPLLGAKGGVLGVCGFEVSEMNFNLNFAPDTGMYKRIGCLISPFTDQGFQADTALFSGNISAFRPETLTINGTYGGLNLYTQAESLFAGLHAPVKLYPADSPFAGEAYATALFLPKEDLDKVLAENNGRIILICVLLLAVGIGASYFISRKYVKPILDGLNMLRAEELPDAVRTNIPEIDELIAEIRARRAKDSPDPDDLFEDFIERVKTLTPTERVIFNYYLEGKNNNEVLALMFISVNTLKTHNSHIYSKLGISSKDELLLYFELIKRSGRLGEIS